MRDISAELLRSRQNRKESSSIENTNQKNTGNIQIAPVSAASDLNHKREGYLTWDEYFMGVAMLSGMRSKDPNSQVGACIVSDDNKILSMG